MTLEPGSIIGGRFRITRLLGAGGMGSVYVAEDVELGRRVAVKVMSPVGSASSEMIKRFRNEAIAAARIRSSHVITVLDVGVDANRHYMVQELLEGFDLRSMIQRGGPLHPTRVVALALQACDALAAAHNAGFVHRDVKPDNLFISQGNEPEERLVLLDFGIAKLDPAPDDGVSITRTGAVVGTPYYMSPEQVMSAKEIDNRTDIYSLGVSLFEALTGEHMISGESFGELVLNICNNPPRRVSEFRQISNELDSLILKCVAKDPSQRFSTAEELFQELQSVPEARELPRATRLPPAPLTSGATGLGSKTQRFQTAASPTRAPWQTVAVRSRALGKIAALPLGVGVLVIAWLAGVGTAVGYRSGLWKAAVFGAGGLAVLFAARWVASRKPALPQTKRAPTPVPAAPIVEASSKHVSPQLDEGIFTRFLTEAGLQVVSRQGAAFMLERTPKSSLRNLSYAAAILEADAPAARATMATAVFQTQASSLYSLRGSPGRDIHAIAVLQSLPGPGIYKEWHRLATTQYLRILPVTPEEIARALADRSAPTLVASLTRRVQHDAFAHGGPVTTDFEFFGRAQLERLVGRLLDGRSFGLFGLYKWGTTSLMLRVRSELETHPTAWVDLAALPKLTAGSILDAIATQLAIHTGEKTQAQKTVLISREPDPSSSLQQVLGRLHGPETPIVFVDRVDELQQLIASAPAELDVCLRLLYSLAFPSPGAPHVLLVLAGNDDQILLQRSFAHAVGEIRNPLWNKLDIEYTSFFEREELADFLARLGPYCGLSFTETCLLEVYRRTGGHKYLCRALGSALAKRNAESSGQGRVRARDVAELAPQLVARQTHYFEAVFERAPKSARRALARLVKGPMAMVEFLGLAADSGERVGGALPALQFALNFGLVAEHGGLYQLRIALLGEWLDLTELHAAPPLQSKHVPHSHAAQPPPPASPSLRSKVTTVVGIALPIQRPAPPDPVNEPFVNEPFAGRTVVLTTPPPDLQRYLRELIIDTFSFEDMQIIAHDLGAKLEIIAPAQAGIELQAMRLIDWSVRTGRFEQLHKLLQDRAPGRFGGASSA